MTGYTTTTLDVDSWEGFSELVVRNDGVYGGCWCIGYHPECGQRIDHRRAKHERVLRDAAHASLVVDDDGLVQGWCQYGDPDELAAIKHRRAYEQAPPPRPDWRITCIFVDKKHRGQGVARLALEAALGQVAARGGGLVEAISETTTGRTAVSRFLFSGTVELFEDLGFTRQRQVGKHAWIVTRRLDAESAQQDASPGGGPPATVRATTPLGPPEPLDQP